LQVGPKLVPHLILAIAAFARFRLLAAAVYRSTSDKVL